MGPQLKGAFAFPLFPSSNPLSQPAMHSIRSDVYPEKRASVGLMLSIHYDAFRTDPRAYLTAMWWRIRRKRLRSRGQLARLLGTSPRAYDMWMLLRNDVIPTADCSDQGPPILALVDVKAAQGRLEDTLRNLEAEAVPALLIGTAEVPDLAEAARQIDWNTKPWLMPIAAGDRLARGAASAYRTAVADLDAGLAYADDDLLSKEGRRTAPHFKPDWNSELFHHFDYLSGACIVRTSREELEAFSGERDWAQKLVAHKAEKGTPVHVHKMLHHRISRPQPLKAVATISAVGKLPPVSVIIPTRNRVDLLRTCLDGIAVTDYPDIEVIIVDNDSDDPQTLSFLAELDPARYRVLRHEGPFNYSALNNRAAEESRGQLLCLLNNDIEIIEPNWLEPMAIQAGRNDVGAVGAQLLYPDGRIQHAGVVLGVGGGTAHAHRLLCPTDYGYFRRHALPQYVSAVTGACLVVKRDRFLAVGGLDATNFAVAFNDIDLCLRLKERGWKSFYEPRATLIHHESISRGLDQDSVGKARLAKELAALNARWGSCRERDPFHHPQLSPWSEQFVVKL